MGREAYRNDVICIKERFDAVAVAYRYAVEKIRQEIERIFLNVIVQPCETFPGIEDI